jgi:hypothetical protein
MASNSNNTIPDDNDTNSPNHPLFLHQNDHPGLILISKKLTGSDNYGQWKRSMLIALNANNKLKIVTGDYGEPDADSRLRALWERTNDMVISWILNTIAEQISNSLNFVNTAVGLWKELQEHYSQLDGHRIFQITNDLVQLKQNNCSIETYYHKLKGLWDECDALEAPYMCVCVCSCENGRVNGEREQRKRLMQFLMGLDECYANVRGKNLLMQPMPTVAKAYGMIRQEEKQREGYNNQSTVTAALSAHSNNPTTYYNNSRNNINFTQGESFNRSHNQGESTVNSSSFKKGVMCGNCGKEGHIGEECYKLVGYPIGHPLHGKYKPPNQRTNFRTVNMTQTASNGTVAQDNQFGSTSSPNSVPASGNDLAMNARMDQLQNQLNQMMLLMQQNTKESTVWAHSTQQVHQNSYSLILPTVLID